MIPDKKAARILFLNGVSQKDISGMLRISEQTISRWKREDNWEEESSRNQLFEYTSAEMVQELIEYQLKVLKQRKEQWEEAGELKLITKGDIDALSKLYSTIKKRETRWGEYINILREFMSWLETQNLQLAKKVVDHIDTFLDAKRKTMQ